MDPGEIGSYNPYILNVTLRQINFLREMKTFFSGGKKILAGIYLFCLCMFIVISSLEIYHNIMLQYTRGFLFE